MLVLSHPVTLCLLTCPNQTTALATIRIQIMATVLDYFRQCCFNGGSGNERVQPRELTFYDCKGQCIECEFRGSKERLVLQKKLT